MFTEHPEICFMRAWYEDYKARIAGAYRDAEKQSKPNLSCSTLQCIACANMATKVIAKIYSLA
jgi:hypothetical protein